MGCLPADIRCADETATSIRTPFRSMGVKNSSSERFESAVVALGGSTIIVCCCCSSSSSSSSTAAAVDAVSLICSLYVLMGSESILSKCCVRVLDIAGGGAAVAGAITATAGVGAASMTGATVLAVCSFPMVAGGC